MKIRTAIPVILFIVLLGFLTIGRFGSKPPSQRNWTIVVHAAIRAALERYKEKFGDYPTIANADETDTFSGKSLRTGGAHMLYQAITADGNSAIVLLPARPGGTHESDGKVDEMELKQSLETSVLPKRCVHPANLPAGTVQARLLIDGWGRPFQYTKAHPDPSRNTAVNPTYDLWSYGPKVNDAPLTETLEAKRDEKMTSSWIKNW
jgi:hypothetical protein